MKAIALSIAAAVVVASGVSAAPRRAQFDPQSWVDDHHGWGARGSFVWATDDGGGHGNDLFSTRDGMRLYRLSPWPPQRGRCRSYWTGYPLGPPGASERPHNVCGGAASMTKLRSRLVWTLPNPDPLQHASMRPHVIVPGGVLGLIYPDHGPAVGVFVYRHGRGYWSKFPGDAGAAAVSVDWPLVVAAGKQASFVSDDGARTWRVVR